jgi:hypothetical protein
MGWDHPAAQIQLTARYGFKMLNGVPEPDDVVP